MTPDTHKPPAAWGAVLVLLALSRAAAAVEVPAVPEAPVHIRADLFAREGEKILYAIGHVHIERGDALVTCDAAVIWTVDHEAYLEGHVVYRTGKSVLEAERAYVRWGVVKDEKTGKEKTVVDKGFMFNAVVRWSERPDRVTWHIRAEEVLQTDVRHFLARGGLVMSPCQFHEPHAFFRATQVELVTDEKLIATNITYHIRGVSLPPIWVFPTYWPKLYVPLGWEWPQMRLQFGSSARYGAFVKSEVIYEIPERLFGVLESEVGVRLDYFSKRGIAYGASFAYRLPDERREGPLGRNLLHGRIEGYRVPNDSGQDFKEFELGTTDRYRLKFAHSQDIPEGFEFDFEYQHISDAGFLPEYFPAQYEQDKPIENRAYLKYSTGPFAAYAHVRWQPEEWLDTTEYLPQVGFNVFSYPVWGNLLYTGHVELANIRRKLSVLRLQPGQDPADPIYDAIRRRWNFFYGGGADYEVFPLESTLQEFLSDGERLWRFNMYHQLSYPFRVHIFDIEPFVGYRGTYYSNTIGGGSGWRSIFVYGARLSTEFWRTWDDIRISTPLLDIQGVRHVITPEIRFLSIEKPSMGVDELILTDDTDFYQPPRDARNAFPQRPYRPYDTFGLAFGDIDAITPVRLVNFALRNRWQTHRGGSVVDFLDIALNLTYYFDADRDNYGRSRGDVSLLTRFSPRRGIFLFTEFGRLVCGRLNGTSEQVPFIRSGVALEFSDRWSFLLAQSYEKGYSNHWVAQLIYQLSKKWRADLRYDFNTEQGSSNELTVRLTRDLHDWIVEFTFQSDTADLKNLIGVSIQPKGRRELVSGLEYTRDLRAGMDAHYRESYLGYDY